MRIITRAESGLKPARSRRYIDTPTDDLFIHHSAGALDAGGNGVWWDDVRGIQDFHMRPVSQGGRGWSDVAYSFLIGGGLVWEGRGVGIAGGHTKGHNTTSHAICFIGSYDFMVPTPEDLRACADLVRHGRDQGWWGDITGGHRDASGASTACPGKHLYDAIPEIRALASATVAIPPPLDGEEDEAMQIVFYADGKGNNHAYAVAANQGKYLPTAEAIERLEFVGVKRANQPEAPLDDVWQSTVALLDGPLRNIEA